MPGAPEVPDLGTEARLQKGCLDSLVCKDSADLHARHLGNQFECPHHQRLSLVRNEDGSYANDLSLYGSDDGEVVDKVL